ncbi:hypothetical protein BV20DRAFT_959908 [Pilatotrama ljubarskyi]|nr:hypothetical protein BV20DRAFT_959908 [Pilatotrama ljubarskyi]
MPDVTVDNANTTAIEYDSYGSAPWQLIRTDNNGAVFAQTLTKVEGTGGVVFRFHGTSVQVYGTVTPPTDADATTTSAYSIDGAHVGSFSSISVPNAVVTEQDGQLFFDSGTLSDGDHVLVINVTLASAAEPFQLDYIKYAATAPTSSSSLSSTSSTTSASATASPASSGSHSDVGPIVGGVVGGVLGFALLFGIGLFLFFRYFRHRISLSGRREVGKVTDLAEELTDDGKPGSDAGPPSTGPSKGAATTSTPWRSGTPTLDVPSVRYALSTVGPDDSASQVAGRIYAAEMAQHAHATSSRGGGVSGASGSGPSSRRERKEPVAPAPPAPPALPEEPEVEALQHQDSGIRFREGDVPPAVLPEIEELPPVYTAT